LITNFDKRTELEGDITERYLQILVEAGVPLPKTEEETARIIDAIISALMEGKLMIIERLPNQPPSRRLSYAFRGPSIQPFNDSTI
jgi:hypothetical protein